MRSSGLRFGPFTFEPGSRLLKRDGIELPLPPRVLGVLEVLLHRAGDVVPRQELIDSVWKDAFVTDTSLAEAVSVLRQTLGDDPQTPSYIQTLHRRGYRFVAPVGETAVLEGAAPPAGRLEPSMVGQWLPWSVAIICVILAAVAVREAVSGREGGGPPVTRFVVAPAPGTRFDARAPAFALSPDASRVAWSACDDSRCRLYVRTSDRLEAVAVQGTDDAAAPFFSPDGRWIGFFADGRLKKIALPGGSSITLADAADPLGAVWTADNRIIYAGAAPGLMAIRDDGGIPIVLTTPRAASGEVRHVWPSIHPGANLLLFTIATVPEVDGDGQLAVLRLDSRKSLWTMIMAGVDRAAPVAQDAIVFSNGFELHASGLDVRRAAITGTPQTLTGTGGSNGQFAVSPAGALLTVSAIAPPERPSFFWWTPTVDGDSSSALRQDTLPGRALENVSLSPDGRYAAGIDRSDASRADIWVVDLERGTASRLTHGGVNAAPAWSADGATVYFASSSGRAFTIHAREVDSQQPARQIHAAAEHTFPSSVSPDGSVLAFTSRGPAAGADVWTLPLNGGEAQPLIRTPFDDVAAVFSPDGRLIAYQSNDAGRWEIYVHRRADERRMTVSTAGGTGPFWSRDGRSLFFRSGDRLMRAGVSPDGSRPGSPEAVARFADAVPIGTDSAGRILFQRRPATLAAEAVIALHWNRELRRLLGPASADMPR